LYIKGGEHFEKLRQRNWGEHTGGNGRKRRTQICSMMGEKKIRYLLKASGYLKMLGRARNLFGIPGNKKKVRGREERRKVGGGQREKKVDQKQLTWHKHARGLKYDL